jgi:hypothetical protein
MKLRTAVLLGPSLALALSLGACASCNGSEDSSSYLGNEQGTSTEVLQESEDWVEEQSNR